LNTELARKPPACLEYVVVHELVHLLEASHNHRFQSLMDGFLPNWRQIMKMLNQIPARLEDGEQMRRKRRKAACVNVTTVT
jgi:predicted metal-dependent hydrolase